MFTLRTFYTTTTTSDDHSTEEARTLFDFKNGDEFFRENRRSEFDIPNINSTLLATITRVSKRPFTPSEKKRESIEEEKNHVAPISASKKRKTYKTKQLRKSKDKEYRAITRAQENVEQTQQRKGKNKDNMTISRTLESNEQRLEIKNKSNANRREAYKKKKETKNKDKQQQQAINQEDAGEDAAMMMMVSDDEDATIMRMDVDGEGDEDEDNDVTGVDDNAEGGLRRRRAARSALSNAAGRAARSAPPPPSNDDATNSSKKKGQRRAKCNDDDGDEHSPAANSLAAPKNEAFYEQVFTTISSDPEAKNAPVNIDAINYEKSIRVSCYFETCAICDEENGRIKMFTVKSVYDRIKQSDIEGSYDRMMSNPIFYDAYKKAIYDELNGAQVNNAIRGLITGCEYICKQCDKQLPPRPTRKKRKADKAAKAALMNVKSFFDEEAKEGEVEDEEVDVEFLRGGGRGKDDAKAGSILEGYGVPNYALVNGHFRGACPPDVAKLNRTELTMVNQINVVSKFIYLPGGGHRATHSNTVFSIINESTRVIEELGKAPDITDLAMIREKLTRVPKEFTWSPFAVQDAIRVIQHNNFLFKNAKVVDKFDQLVDLNETHEGITIEATKSEVKYLEVTTRNGDHVEKDQEEEEDGEEEEETEEKEGDKYHFNCKMEEEEIEEVSLLVTADDDLEEEDNAATATATALASAAKKAAALKAAAAAEVEKMLNDTEDFYGDDILLEGDAGASGYGCLHTQLKEIIQNRKYAKGRRQNMLSNAGAAAGGDDDAYELDDELIKEIPKAGDWVSMHKTDWFLQMAFVDLFPYGHGGPRGDNDNVIWDDKYVTHLMKLGRTRDFQRSSNFIFFAYNDVIKKRIGGIAMLTAKHSNGQPELRNGEALQLLNYLGGPDILPDTTPTVTLTDSKTGILSVKELNQLVNRTLPFVSSNLPGSELFFKEERKNLFAMIRSPIISNIQFFATFAQPDAHLFELYINAVTSSGNDLLGSLGKLKYLNHTSSIEAREAVVNILSAKTRLIILRKHPALSARLHDLRDDIFWKEILNGKHLPLGQKITDFWRRLEFQLRGFPHTHNLIYGPPRSRGLFVIYCGK